MTTTQNRWKINNAMCSLVLERDAFNARYLEEGQRLVKAAIAEFMERHPEVRQLNFQANENFLKVWLHDEPDLGPFKRSCFRDAKELDRKVHDCLVVDMTCLISNLHGLTDICNLMYGMDTVRVACAGEASMPTTRL